MSGASPAPKQELAPIAFVYPPIPVPEVKERTDALVWWEWDEAVRQLEQKENS